MKIAVRFGSRKLSMTKATGAITLLSDYLRKGIKPSYPKIERTNND